MQTYSKLTLLGSTGSIGRQTVNVAKKKNISVYGLSANKNVDLIENQARELGVRVCVMVDCEAAKTLKIKLADTSVRVLSGEAGLEELISDQSNDSQTVLNAIIGEAGLKSTLNTIKSGKRLALANKESLVCAGHIVNQMLAESTSEIIPVDSEHSAIFQCLQAGKKEELNRIILTASGGPFFGKTKDQLEKITPAAALNHPTWSMGNKITIDSATLMNKGFELIEAVHLFHVRPDQVDVVVHRESQLHSAVEFCDRSVIAQMSVPNMELCIQYALTYPFRDEGVIEPLDLIKIGSLSFYRPDERTFSLLPLARNAIREGGALPAVMNAANEIAVQAFLTEKISFANIMNVVEKTVCRLDDAKCALSLDDVFCYDKLARQTAAQLINKE